MGLPVCVAGLVDGSGALFVPALPVELPPEESGVLVRPAGSADLRFVAAHPAGLSTRALELAGSSVGASVVVCPAGVEVERHAMALAVADVLGVRRSGGASVVTSALLPSHAPFVRAGAQWSAVLHEVRLRSVPGVMVVRAVWEIVGWSAVAGALATLAGAA
ncbi:hypothetical protein [Frankia sp. AgW1.1]|uniref:hypothetical protein n=1 Tax=Frankia sp. AgW1.1 TaxID=1836971 RepID=UPI00193180EE|nr:hypothetical protein [Frankia sp. AgW1.1]MBL7490225.1 hypothetical protein [Frankia sp. AgW1.1]